MNTPPATQAPTGVPAWRALIEHPLFLGALLLAPVLFVLPPLPIDETRYLAVAWEMRQTGEFLVPHLNGDLYSQKPPLLFWLLNAGWFVTGVHAWSARAVTLICSLLSLLLLEKLTLRITGSRIAARISIIALLGMLYFAAFANAIMFDVLLTTCALIALHGILDLVEDRRRRGIVLTGLGIGLGILTKGPVLLLDIGFAALLAPWWSGGLPRGNARYFGALGAAILLGVTIALVWVIPAALHGGPEYARAILLHQTFDRIEGVKTGTHAQPIWWYVVALPLMVLPWPLVLRSRGAALKALLSERGVRLALAWVVPTVIVFSLIGGKQAHYLLPLLPGVALALAIALERRAFEIRIGFFALILLALGVAMAWLPRYATTANLAFIDDTSPWWGAGFAAIGIVLLVGAKRLRDPLWPALATLAVVLVIKLALIQGPGVRYDARPISAQVHAAQMRGQPIAHLGWHHGVYEFAGRLTEPLPVLTAETLPAWAAEHPDGLVLSFYRRFRFRAEPIYSQPFRGVQASIWNVRDAIASGVDPTVDHARDDSDDTPDDD